MATTTNNNIETELQARLAAVNNANNSADLGQAIAASATAAAAAAREEQQHPAPQPAHGYADIQPGAPVDQAHIHPSLRAGPAPKATLVPTANMMPAPAPGPPGPVSCDAPTPVTLAAATPLATLPAVAVAAAAAAAVSAADATQAPAAADGRKQKRELSQSKRAAQNRAAQRAFRQRKETHIKKLEAQVKHYEQLEVSYKHFQQQYLALQNYVVGLQSRMQAASVEVPPAPFDLNSQPPMPTLPDPTSNCTVEEGQRDAAGTAISAMAQLGALENNQAAAAAAAAAAAVANVQSEDVKMEAEIARQLQSDVQQQS